MSLSEIITHWKLSGIKLNDGARIEKINALEGELNFSFPASFKDFYKEVNGFKDWDWNENMFTIYPIERIRKEHSESINKSFIPFCDYLINSHQIGFDKTNGKVYLDYPLEGGARQKVADTFTQSLIEIVKNSEKIY